MIGALVFLSILEVVRYRTARGGDEIPYPRRRLIRRLSIAGFFIVILLIIACGEPPWGPWWKIAYLSSILFLTLLGIGLVGRELAETSRAALAQAEAFNRAAAQNIAKIIEERKKKNDQPNHEEKQEDNSKS